MNNATDFSKLTATLDHNPGADRATVAAVGADLDVILPPDYVDFLAYSNGAEGPMGTWAYIKLWAAEDLVRDNEGYDVRKLAPGLLLFGSDGADTAFGFDFRSQPPEVVTLPFIGLKVDEIEVRDSTFTAFLERLGES